MTDTWLQILVIISIVIPAIGFGLLMAVLILDVQGLIDDIIEEDENV